jgi:hypothetical protein
MGRIFNLPAVRAVSTTAFLTEKFRKKIQHGLAVTVHGQAVEKIGIGHSGPGDALKKSSG